MLERMSSPRLSLLLLLFTAALCVKTIVVNDPEAYTTNSYAIPSPDHKEVAVISAVHNDDTNTSTLYFYDVKASDVADGETKTITEPDHTITIPATERFSAHAAPLRAFDRGQDHCLALSYDGTTLNQATIADRSAAMPMMCDGEVVYIITGLEILKYNLDLELQANVTLGTTGTSYLKVLPYNKNGISVVGLAFDALFEHLVLTAINTDFTAVVSTVVSDFESVEAPLYSTRLSASLAGAGSSEFGFIDYDHDTNSWVFTKHATLNHPEDTDGGGISAVVDDTLNGVVVVTTSLFTGRGEDFRIATSGSWPTAISTESLEVRQRQVCTTPLIALVVSGSIWPSQTLRFSLRSMTMR
ncbi:hypothetical protein J8273_3095 [Carpediemonas membranifera]|uniref:Uncharacterized protein n=1 Tax=Carpediemonas membranifera TaxID=201153 RepID=A0A8J6B8R2_9EUKA|nr:hypothetical protein J8273_3095 [Carpediemonas membranifera]|eukprot:KAG9395519.1 hypothetical protein J8273_3095 [Carpediemonas membranifera]